MTNEKLIALLREVQEAADSVDGLGYDLSLRINAALAEAQDSAKDVVEWGLRSGSLRTSFPNGIGAQVYVSHQDAPNFAWKIWGPGVAGPSFGRAPTEAEAKEAAIKAARGLR